MIKCELPHVSLFEFDPHINLPRYDGTSIINYGMRSSQIEKWTYMLFLAIGGLVCTQILILNQLEVNFILTN